MINRKLFIAPRFTEFYNALEKRNSGSIVIVQVIFRYEQILTGKWHCERFLPIQPSASDFCPNISKGRILKKIRPQLPKLLGRRPFGMFH